jgi:hypothetical protein
MVPRNNEGVIRLGVLALPLAGLLALVGLYSSFQLGTGGILATGDNRAIVSGGYYVSQLLGNALALTILIFGLIALYAYLAASRVSGLAFLAMVSSIFGIALQLIGLGVFAFAIPALSRSFLGGSSESIRILDYIFEGPFRIVVTLALLLYVAGFILWGVAIWRSRTLPKWAGVLVAVHAPLLVFGPLSVVGPVVGALLALVGGGWIALSVLRSPPGAEVHAEAVPHVR